MKIAVLFALLFGTSLSVGCSENSESPLTYCNLLDLDYGRGGFQQTLRRIECSVYRQDIAFASEIRYAAQDSGRCVAWAMFPTA
ncbi:MAG: hypothetical protein NC250_03860 [Alistipes senegalensis]|nr:hypothetical protein [Bacteroides cellulosilyticus]MCM1351850.1 hypothetical protein [Alistipes senegalensis]